MKFTVGLFLLFGGVRLLHLLLRIMWLIAILVPELLISLWYLVKVIFLISGMIPFFLLGYYIVQYRYLVFQGILF